MTDESQKAIGGLTRLANALEVDYHSLCVAMAHIKRQEARIARLQNGITNASADVLAERKRQVEEEGWTPAHDDTHVNDEIAALATFYAMPPGARAWPFTGSGYGDTLGDAILPDGGWYARAGDRRRDLVKAGALILAEIERIDRAAAKRSKENE